MPVNPIGEKNRKGTLGSPYAVRDYYAVNPEFGDLADLQHFVDTAHELGLHVILDWVANHTAWDNNLVESHPEWYARDWKGDFRPTPWWDWDDIIDLDYSHEALREYMAEAMCYWVREADIDGYRCDVAGHRARRLLGAGPPRPRRDQAGLHARGVGGPGPAPARVRHDVRLVAGTARCTDRERPGEPRAAAGLLRLERRCLAHGLDADDVRQQPRQERLGGHRVRAVRRRARGRDRAVGRRRGDAADLQRPGGGQRPPAAVLRARTPSTGASTTWASCTGGCSR